MSGARRLVVRAGLPALVIVLLAWSRPWTIRPIDTPRASVFDAASYVDTVWPRVVSEAAAEAVDVAAAIRGADGAAAGTRRAAFVKGRGVVTGVDLRSRVGLARVRIGGLAPPGEVAIQLGPVLRGTAVRDAASFVRFTDFANQSDFASVSNGLNERVLRDVLAPLDPAALSGRTLAFVGAMAIGGARAGSPVEITPIELRVDGGGR